MRAFEIRSVREGEVVDVDDPTVGPTDVLVRVAYCGVCGTDLHIFHGEFPTKLPLVPGHEFSGVLEGIGRDVRGLSVGDYVAVDPNISCGSCYYCKKGMPNFCERWQAIGVTRQGAFAELVSVPASNAYLVPRSTPLERFSFVEPVSCILHGIDRVSPREGEKALVTGLGPIGLMFGQLLKRMGVRVMGADVVETRLRVATKVGFDQTMNPAQDSVEKAVSSWTSGRGLELVVEASGSTEALGEALGMLDKGGRILVFGVAPEKATVTIRPFQIYRNEVSLIGSFTNPNTFGRAVEAISEGRVSVDEFGSKIIGLDDVERSLEEMPARKEIKYLVRPG